MRKTKIMQVFEDRKFCLSIEYCSPATNQNQWLQSRCICRVHRQLHTLGYQSRDESIYLCMLGCQSVLASLTLVVWVINHRWFPFTVHLIIPVIWFLGLWVRDVFWLVPVFWFSIFWVINFLIVFPVFWFLGLWIRDFLWGKEVPISLKISALNLLVVDLHNVGVV